MTEKNIINFLLPAFCGSRKKFHDPGAQIIFDPYNNTLYNNCRIIGTFYCKNSLIIFQINIKM